MLRNLLISLLLACTITCLGQTPKHEVRAAWVATAYSLDWPSTHGATPEAARRQQEELMRLLDCLRGAGINTVLFQTRSRGSTMHRSDFEPWSDELTGRVGQEPAYDPLAFVVEECHKRGMECHAYIVAIPLGTRRQHNKMGAKTALKHHPELVVNLGGNCCLNPGHPGTPDYLARIAGEIVDRYDVDGIHLDYIRYPERTPNFPDGKEFRKYGAGRSRQEWRTDNITRIVRAVSKAVKGRKPWVKVSASVVGKRADLAHRSSGGWNAKLVGQDVEAWLSEGLVDQVYPMMYFQGSDFRIFADDWAQRAHGRTVVAGLGVYFLDPKEGNMVVGEVERQIDYSREVGLGGQACFRAAHIAKDVGGLRTLLTTSAYRLPALVPPIASPDTLTPTPPSAVRAHRLAPGYYRLTWQHTIDHRQHPDDAGQSMAKDGKTMTNDGQHMTYVVYGGDSPHIDTADPKHIIAITPARSAIYAPDSPLARARYITVTAIDRYGRESTAARPTEVFY